MWLVNEHGRYFFPETAACQAFREAYQGTHYKREALGNWLVEVMVTSPMKSIVSWLHETGLICIMNNPNTRPPLRSPQVRPMQPEGHMLEKTGRFSLSCQEYWAISGISWW